MQVHAVGISIFCGLSGDSATSEGESFSRPGGRAVAGTVNCTVGLRRVPAYELLSQSINSCTYIFQRAHEL